MTIEQRIDELCEHLPEGWEVRIELERGAATVRAVRPDGSEVLLGDDPESGLAEQLREAGILARDETESDRLLAPNGKAQPLRADEAADSTKGKS